MKNLFLIIFLFSLVATAKAQTPEEFKACVQEQLELVEENRDSYSVAEIAAQIDEAPLYCNEESPSENTATAGKAIP